MSMIAICLMISETSVLQRDVKGAVGFVLEIHGEWTYGSPPKDLSGGDLLPAQARIAPKYAVSGVKPSITVSLFTGKSQVHEKETVLPDLPPPPPLTSRIWRSVAQHYTPQLARTMVRGTKFSDGIVKLKDNSLDISELCRLQIEGDMRLSFTPIVKGSYVLESTRSFDVHWMAAGPKTAAVGEAITPGLYLVAIKDRNGSEKESAWILISSEDDFDDAYEDYREAKKITDEWEGIKSPVKARFLRGLLVSVVEDQRK